MQLHQSEVLSELERLDAGLLVISFGNLEQLSAWVPQFRKDFFAWPPDSPPGQNDPFRRTRFLTDPVLLAYGAYGLDRHTASEVYGLKILWQYAQWAVEGKPIRHADMDVYQRGGNFVVGRNGRLTLAHVPQDPSNRPSVETILAACRRGGS